MRSVTLSDAEKLSPLKQAYLALEKAEARLASLEGARREGIAVVGMGCRFPGPKARRLLAAAGLGP